MGDRPLIRRLIKLGATLTGPARAHRQDIWPGLDIDRATGQVTWRSRPLLRLSSFRQLVPQGLPLIAIIGSGPSLTSQHPERLPVRTSILLNGAASLAERVQPLAVMVEDERFVFRHMAMLAGLPREVPLMLSPAAMRAMAERTPDLLRDRAVALVENLLKPLGGVRRTINDPSLSDILTREADQALSIDPDRGVVIHGTVALSAVQVALHARPKRIVLAGIDLGNAGAPRFYETTDDSAPSGLLAGQARILGGFALARDMARAQDTELLCASPVSRLLAIGIARTEMLS